MKKKKLLINFVSILFFIELFNRIVFMLSSIQYKKTQRSYHWYSWRFGKIHYKVKGDGPPLLLIHGIGAGASSYEWRKNIPYLSKDFKVYTIDLLGYGLSSKPKITYTAYLYVQLIQDFIKNVIKEPTSVIANSQSASFSVMASSLSPSLFKKLILISPTGINKNSTYPTLKSMLIKNIIEMPILGTALYQFISSKPYIFYFIKHNLYKSFRSISYSLIRNYYGSAHTGGPDCRYTLASFLGGHMNVDVESALKGLSHDICIIWGKDNTLVPIHLLDQWQSINPSISSFIFEKSKVMPHEEEPLKFNELCTEILLKKPYH